MKSFSFIVVLAISLVTAPGDLNAQVDLERSVIGTMGGSESLGGNITIDYTVGEAVIDTRSDGDFLLTQGFHQPFSKGPLRFNIETSIASCPSATDGGAQITELAGCSPPYVITWSTGESGISVDRLSPGFYSVTISSGPCSETIEFEVLSGPIDNCTLRFFNAFSPNSDGISDFWTIENIDLPEFSDNKVEIFNRWGQEVFSGTTYDNSTVVWEGSDKNGNDLPSGTYYYIAEVAGTLYKGYIELIR